METRRRLSSVLGGLIGLLVMAQVNQVLIDAILYYGADLSRESLLRLGLIAGTVWLTSLIALVLAIHRAVYRILTGETYVGKK